MDGTDGMDVVMARIECGEIPCLTTLTISEEIMVMQEDCDNWDAGILLATKPLPEGVIPTPQEAANN